MGKLKPGQLLRILLLSAIWLPTSGHAVSVTPIVGAEVTRSSTSNKTRSFTSDALLNFGLGGLLEFRPLANSNVFGLETGLLYLRREISYGSPANETFTYLELPLLARFHVSLFSLGLGGYLAEGLGHISVGSPGSQSKLAVTYSDGGIRRFEYGFTGALSYCPPNNFFAEFRYNGGLRNLALATNTTYRFDDAQFFVGWRFNH